MTRTIPINLNLHIEPEDYFIGEDENYDFKGFEKSFEIVEETRKKFNDQGKSFNVQWLLRLDKQIEKVYGDIGWSLKKYEKELLHLNGQGDEIGIHLHSYQWDETRKNWFVDYTDQSYINHLITDAIATYKNHFGALPKIFSMGDTWINNETMNKIEDAGIKYELSPIPGRKPKHFPTFNGKYIGSPTNYEKMPHEPYHPERSNFCTAGESKSEGIWVIPLTSGNWKSKFYLKDTFKRILKTRSIKGQLMAIDKFQVLSGIYNSKKEFYSRIGNDSTTHFAFECRTALFSTERGIQSYYDLVDFFSRQIKRTDFVFTTAEELVTICKSEEKLAQV